VAGFQDTPALTVGDGSATVPAMSEETHEELQAEALRRIIADLGLPPEITNEANFDVAGIWDQSTLDHAFGEWMEGLAPMPLLPGDLVPDYTEIVSGNLVFEWNGDSLRTRFADEDGEERGWLEYDRAVWTEDSEGRLCAFFEIPGLRTFTGPIDYVVVY